MLDQNTDRMWYVIGAVLIGAAIIFGMNTLMPEAFASISDNFEQVVSLTGEKVSSMNGNILAPDNLTEGYRLNEHTGGLIRDDGRVLSGHIPIDAGESYTYVTRRDNNGYIYMRVAYYNSRGVFIEGHRSDLLTDFTSMLTTVAPENATYARIQTNTGYAPVDTWWFGKTDDW